MGQALALAEAALGSTWPNPAVGCVIVADGKVVGQAATASGGRPHAETQALAMAGSNAQGATAYVTLEPCAHTGQTGPCAGALAAAGIARVVTAMIDPDPRVSGTGLRLLREAGVQVTLGPGAKASALLLEGFTTRIALGRPAVTLKLAQTLDGRIALEDGKSRWITGPEARGHVHRLRARTDAILIGSGTALADDPMLDVRAGEHTTRPPVRIVADSQLRLPTSSRLAQTTQTQPLWLLHLAIAPEARKAALAAIGATLIEVPTGSDGLLDIHAALHILGQNGLTAILCEGGGTLAASLIASGCADSLLTILSGKIIGAEGLPSIGPLGATDLAGVPHFRLTDTMPLGNDLALTWRAAPTGP